MGHVFAAPARSVRAVVEPLENRQLLTAAVTAAIPNATAMIGGAAGTLDLASYFNDPTPAGTLVTMNTSLGAVPVQLSDAQTPLTVENFLKYVAAGRYNGTIIHRSVANFVVQGGGFTGYNSDHIPDFDPVQNEFSPTRSNLRGTIAMAKKGGDPDSATSEWFFNLADNSSNLDNQNGGFTTFGNVVGDGMGVVDAIAAVTTYNGGGAFTNLPLRDFNGGSPSDANYVKVNTATPDYTYAVAVDNPNVVEATLRGQVLTYAAKAGGIANITVTATDTATGQTAAQTFQVGVDAQVIKIGSGGAKAVTFRAAQGGTITISLTGGGSADVTVAGTNAAVANGSKGATVSGTDLSLGAINVTGTRNGSKLTIKPSGTYTTSAALNLARTLGTIDAGRVNFTGNLTSAASLGNVTFKSAGGVWAVNGGAKRLKAESTGSTWDATFTGGVANVDVRRTMSGDLSAATAGTVKAGKLADGSLTLTRSSNSAVLKKLSAGSFQNYAVISAGGVGDVTSKGAMTNSSVRLGLQPALQGGGSSASSIGDFARPGATLKSLTIKASRNSFVDSSIVVGRIGKLTLGTFNDAPGQAAFAGVQADRIGSLTGRVGGKRFAVVQA
ncbi:MAG TPA: peptidylprolyl isomerase, partial [Tepidisphaeraceae bacterium]|nr:peptidylprolyl isomerase [Tepidisphaeraceae bacterium]